MDRYLAPTLAFGMTAWLNYQNQALAPEGKAWVVPGVDLVVPSTAGDPVAMGQASVWVALAISLLMLASAVRTQVANHRRRARLEALSVPVDETVDDAF